MRIRNLYVIVLSCSICPFSILATADSHMFSSRIDYKTVGQRPVSMSALDLDGDSDSDLAVANVYSDIVSVLFDIHRPPLVCGDTAAGGSIDIDDVVCIMDHLFLGGPSPDPEYLCNIDCSGSIELKDVVLMNDHIFSSGYAPCDSGEDGVREC